jgi:putative chitinase
MEKPAYAATPMHMPTFFSWITRAPYGGRISQSQVDGVNDLLRVWAEIGDGDDRKLAYICATDHHETGGRMQPVREGFASTDAKARRAVNALAKKRGPNSAVAKYALPTGPYGHVYYGRGDVQNTWLDNYQKAEDHTGIQFVKYPDLMLESENSKRWMIEGMTIGDSGRGDFTGKALADYFNETVDDPVGARRIVNGTDKDELIAGYYEFFYAAIKAAQAAQVGEREPEAEAEPEKVSLLSDPTALGGIVTAGTGAMSAVSDLTGSIDNPYQLGVYALLIAAGGLVLFGRYRLNYKSGM